MLKLAQSADIPRAAKRHAWVCLLLPVLLLCNPFLATPESSGILAVHHRPSYRATVASAELLKFKNSESREAIAIADLDLFEAFTLPRPQMERSAGHGETEDLRPADQFLSGDLWFRPPPVA